MNEIGKIIFSIGLAISSLFGFHQIESPQNFGATFTPIGTTQFTLAGAGITSTANTIQLTSFLLPDRVTPITMSMIGSIGYGVLEPQSSKIEDITFTGVTQNANGTAILTGVSRGISFYSPYHASTTLAYSHSGGATFIISNTAGFYGQQFMFTNNPNYVTAYNQFTDPPVFVNAATSTHQAADVAYVNSVVAAGCANASETVNGCSQLSTTAQATAGTSLGSTGARLVIPNSMANATPSANILVPITSALGKLAQGFLDLTQSFSFSGGVSVVGNLSVPSGTNIIASSTQYTLNVGSVNATSSLTVVGKTLGDYILYLANDTTGTSQTSTTTILTYQMPANTMGIGKMLRISTSLTPSINTSGGSQNYCDYNVDFGTGNATTTVAFGQVQTIGGNGIWGFGDMKITAFATTTTSTVFNSQSTQALFPTTGNTSLVNTFSPLVIVSGATGSVGYMGAARSTTPLTGTTYIAFRAKAEGGGITCFYQGITIELLSQ